MEQHTQQLGISRDELHERALHYYLQERQVNTLPAGLAGKSITERLNEYYSKHDSRLDPLFVEMQARSIPHKEW